MKDQYVGDVNDYLKYALLRALTGQAERLVVAWMLTPSDERTDGRRLSYLHQGHRYRRLDPTLFDALNSLVTADARSVRAVEDAGLLADSAYVKGALTDDRFRRDRYFEDVWAATSGRTLLFFDPDNGMAVRSVRKGARNSSKYLYWDELQKAYREGVSLIVYQHFPRRPRHLFLRELAGRVHEVTDSARVLALSTPHVAFIVVPQTDRARGLQERLENFSQHAAPFGTSIASIRTV
jgi:hypothetical protein